MKRLIISALIILFALASGGSKAIELFPSFVIALSNRGSAYYNLDLFDDALLDFTNAATFAPQYIPAVMGIANTYYQLDDWQTAITYFTRVIELDPNNGDAYFWRGRTYAQLGDTKQAELDSRRAYELWN